MFGARKVRFTLNRQRNDGEAPIARCTVEALMAELGLAGAIRGKIKRTTISDPRTAKPGDLVNRKLSAPHTGPALGRRLHLRLDLVGLVLHRFVVDAYCPTHPGLVGGDHDDQPARRRRR